MSYLKPPTSQKDTGSAPYVKTSVFGGGDIKDSIWNFSGISAPIKVLQDNTYGVGVTVSTPPLPDTPNFDGTVRSAPLIVSANDQIYPSVALETLRAYYDQPNYQTRVTPEVGIEWIRMGRQQPIETTSTSDVMITYWNKFQRVSASELDESYQNKILIWGMTAEGFNNPVSTPYGVMYPHEVQANLLQTVLSGDRIQNNFLLDFAEIVLVIGLGLLVLFMVYQFPTYLSGIASITVIGFSVAVSYWIWIENLILFDSLYASLTGLLVFGHASFNKYFVTYKLKEQIKGQFKKYLSPEMVDELAKNPELLKLGGERKEMTFMFMDICGFTPISEKYKNDDDPEGLVELINKFLDIQTKIIINNKGTIDKYMGDCIMAFWNAPLDCKDHAELAVKSALEVLDATKKLNQELSPLNLPPINVGIGISTGECIVGNMGSEIRFDYSVIGDAVNLNSDLRDKQEIMMGWTCCYRKELIDYVHQEHLEKSTGYLLKVNPKRFEYTHHWELIDHPTKFDWTLFVTLQLADIYTTYRGLKYECIEEANPLFGKRPTVNDMFFTKFAVLTPAIQYDRKNGNLNKRTIRSTNAFMAIVIGNNLNVTHRAKRTCKKLI